MPLVSFDQPQILVEISDLTIDNSIIKRKARFNSLYYTQNPTMEINPFFPVPKQKVVINLTIDHYSNNADGSYGQSLANVRAFNSYPFDLIADHTTLVDATTGAKIGDASLLDDPANSLPSYTDDNGTVHPAGILYGKDYMYEDEFFRRMAAGIAVIVDNLIIQYIQAANAAGRF